MSVSLSFEFSSSSCNLQYLSQFYICCVWETDCTYTFCGFCTYSVTVQMIFTSATFPSLHGNLQGCFLKEGPAPQIWLGQPCIWWGGEVGWADAALRVSSGPACYCGELLAWSGRGMWVTFPTKHPTHHAMGLIHVLSYWLGVAPMFSYKRGGTHTCRQSSQVKIKPKTSLQWWT